MNKDSKDQENIYFALIIGCSLSLIGCFFIISAYFCLKLKILAYRLVVYIAVADIIHSACLMLPVSDPWCHVQGFLLQYSSLSSILWTAIMSFSLYQAVIKLNTNIESYEKKYLILGFAAPVLVSVLPEISSAYGYSQGWCWITNDGFNVLYRIFCFYLVLVVVFVYNCGVYWVVWKKIREEVLGNVVDDEINKINRDMITRLKMYPVVLFVSYAGVSTKRIFELFWPKHLEVWLVMAAGISMSLIGFLDALVYGFSREVRKNIFICLRRGNEDVEALN
jgi:hypothetical protein